MQCLDTVYANKPELYPQVDFYPEGTMPRLGLKKMIRSFSFPLFP